MDLLFIIAWMLAWCVFVRPFIGEVAAPIGAVTGFIVMVICYNKWGWFK